MGKLDWIAICLLIIIVGTLAIAATVSETRRREHTRAADVGNGYWCPKHGAMNVYHYTKKECKHDGY